MTQIKLVDINPQIVQAFESGFADHPEVEAICGDITKQKTDVWVTPTNSKGHMSGGVDLAIRNHLGPAIQVSIQDAIQNIYEGLLPVGKAVIVDAPVHSHELPRFVVATPSMVGESDDLRRTKNTALACAAAFQAIYYAEDKHGAPIDSVAIPGLGSGTGKMPVDDTAALMLVGYRLFRRKRYDSFDEMLEHLHEELGEVGLGAAAGVGPQPGAGKVQQTVEGGIEKASMPEYNPDKPGMVDEKVGVDIETPGAGIVTNPPFHGEQASSDNGSSNEVSADSEPEKPVSAGDQYISEMPIGTPLV